MLGMTYGLGESLVKIAGDSIIEIGEHRGRIVGDGVIAHLDPV